MRKKTKQKKQKGGFARKTVTTLDWVLLPITEIRYLKKSVGLLVTMIKELFVFSWAVIRVNSKEMVNSEFYKKIAKRTGPVEFAQSLSFEQHEMLRDNLTKGFLRKRLAALSFVFIIFLFGVVLFSMSFFVDSPSLFRMVILLFMLLSVAAYLYVSITHYENLSYYYENFASTGVTPNSLRHKTNLLRANDNE